MAIMRIEDFVNQAGGTADDIQVMSTPTRDSITTEQQSGYIDRAVAPYAQKARESIEAYHRGEQSGLATLFQYGGYGIGAGLSPFMEAPGVKQGFELLGTGIAKGVAPVVSRLSDTAMFREATGGDLGSQADFTKPLERNIEAGLEYLNILPFGKAAKLAPKVKAPKFGVDISGSISGTKRFIEATTETLERKAKESLKSDVEKTLAGTKSLQNTTKLYEQQRKIPITENLSEPAIFRGLKVKDGQIVPDEAVEIFEKRIDTLMDAKSKLLPQLEKYAQPISREVLRQRAIEAVRGLSTPADEAEIIKAINRQINALPENLTLSQLDNFRAQARKSARDAKQLQKRDSEYSALENSARDTLFDATDRLQVDQHGQFAALNTEIKNMIGTKEFLDKVLRGQTVKGGRLGTYAGRIIGGMAGTSGGPLGVILGSEAGAVVANILRNNQLGSGLKMRLIREVTDDPDVITAAEKYLRDIEQYTPQQLPAGTPGAPKVQGEVPIEIPPRGSVPRGLGDEPMVKS